MGCLPSFWQWAARWPDSSGGNNRSSLNTSRSSRVVVTGLLHRLVRGMIAKEISSSFTSSQCRQGVRSPLHL